jgi:hypothetical protein
VVLEELYQCPAVRCDIGEKLYLASRFQRPIIHTQCDPTTVFGASSKAFKVPFRVARSDPAHGH